jgi:L-lactate dehydrogenase complex protein LldF
MQAEQFAELADLPKACSVCGACNEVCPVNLPLPDLLLRLRDRAKKSTFPRPTPCRRGAAASFARG